MSASRDKSQKIGFVYSNLYQLYKKGQDAAMNADVSAAQAESSKNTASRAVTPPPPPAHLDASLRAPVGLTRGRILKSETLEALKPKVESFNPAEFLDKRIEREEAAQAHTPIQNRLTAEQLATLAQAIRRPQPLYIKTAETALKTENAALSSLRDNLNRLTDLHTRLQFMLKEIEDLTREE